MVMIARLAYAAFSVLLAVLAAASPANAQAAQMSYTFSGTAVDNGSNGSPSHSVTLDVGPTASPFVVIAIHEQNGHQSGATVTVGGVSLTQDFVDGTGQVGFYSGVATRTSGNQTVTFTQARSTYETVGFSLWSDLLISPLSSRNLRRHQFVDDTKVRSRENCFCGVDLVAKVSDRFVR